MSHSSHFMKICRQCGVMVAQCRCPSQGKRIEYIDQCWQCAQTMRPPSGVPSEPTLQSARRVEPADEEQRGKPADEERIELEPAAPAPMRPPRPARPG